MNRQDPRYHNKKRERRPESRTAHSMHVRLTLLVRCRVCDAGRHEGPTPYRAAWRTINEPNGPSRRGPPGESAAEGTRLRTIRGNTARILILADSLPGWGRAAHGGDIHSGFAVCRPRMNVPAAGISHAGPNRVTRRSGEGRTQGQGPCSHLTPEAHPPRPARLRRRGIVGRCAHETQAAGKQNATPAAARAGSRPFLAGCAGPGSAAPPLPDSRQRVPGHGFGSDDSAAHGQPRAAFRFPEHRRRPCSRLDINLSNVNDGDGALERAFGRLVPSAQPGTTDTITPIVVHRKLASACSSAA